MGASRFPVGRSGDFERVDEFVETFAVVGVGFAWMVCGGPGRTRTDPDGPGRTRTDPDVEVVGSNPITPTSFFGGSSPDEPGARSVLGG